MAYVPGPLILQSTDNVAFQPYDYDFTDYAADGLADVDSILSGWDDFILDAGVLLDEPSDPFPDIDLNAATDALGVYSDPVGMLGIDGMISALADADLGLSIAIGFAPAEAWVDPAAAFVAPGPAEVIAIPVIPPGAIDFSVTGTVSNPPAAGSGATPAGPASVSLTNTTAYGNPNFTVGDGFIVQVTGPVGADISADSTLNGVEQGYADFGAIGPDGTWSTGGTMDYLQIGVWTENWYIAGQLVASFGFIVLDS